jgi:diguanylate cyclase (GGDEF)-like protein
MPAVFDQVTPILEWDPFASMANLLFSQTLRRQTSLSLMQIALDGERSRTDEEAESILANAIAQSVRQGDLIGRRQTGVFAVLLTDTPQAGALYLSDRIQARFRDDQVTRNQEPATISVGIAGWPESATTAGEMLSHAGVALAEAADGGGNRGRLYGWDGADRYLLWDTAHERAESRRHASRLRLTAAFDRGLIKGIGITALPDACPACRAAARDTHWPDALPPLPLAGCSSLLGCRCCYASPALEARPLLSSVALEDAADLDIPRRLRDAALFGSQPRGRCNPADLATYFERFPFLRLRAELKLPDGEAVYLKRPAQEVWEQPSTVSLAIHGPELPVETPMPAWLAQAGSAPSLPGRALQRKREGTFYLTNRRLLFAEGFNLTGLPLLQIAGCELLRDGLAFRSQSWQSRLVFLLSDPIPVALYVARAMRAELLLR